MEHTVGLAVRQRPNEHWIRDGKHRRRDGDADRLRGNRGHGERWLAAPKPQCEPNVRRDPRRARQAAAKRMRHREDGLAPVPRDRGPPGPLTFAELFVEVAEHGVAIASRQRALQDPASQTWRPSTPLRAGFHALRPFGRSMPCHIRDCRARASSSAATPAAVIEKKRRGWPPRSPGSASRVWR